MTTILNCLATFFVLVYIGDFVYASRYRFEGKAMWMLFIGAVIVVWGIWA